MADGRKQFGALVAKHIRAAGGMKGKTSARRREIFGAAARKARAEMGGSRGTKTSGPRKAKASPKQRAAARKNIKKAQAALRRSSGKRSVRRSPGASSRIEANLEIPTPGITQLKTRRGGQRRGDPHATPIPTLNSFIIGSDGELPLPGFVSGTRSHSKLPRG